MENDLINRKSALKALRPIMRKSDYFYEMLKAIQDVPPAEPERKKGVWIEVDDHYNRISGRCSACGWESHLYEDDVVGMNFCPNCVADMRGDKNETD